MFQDEGRFGRINAVRRCWAPGTFRPTVAHQLVREYLYVYCAVSPHDGVMDSLILPRADTPCMSLFLEEVSARHADESILMFLDGAGWHIAKDLKIPPNMTLMRQPPYSPELNPVEHVWDEIREKWLYNKVFDSLDGVEETLVTAIFELENDTERTQSITGFPWIIIASLNAT